MRIVNYNGQKIGIPETINGKSLRNVLRIPRERTVYVTDLDGKSRIVSDGDTMYVTDNMEVGDIPRTTKG